MVQSDSRLTKAVGAFLVILRSEEHTSELQSQSNLVCRLLLEKKKKAFSTVSDESPSALRRSLTPASLSPRCFSSLPTAWRLCWSATVRYYARSLVWSTGLSL